VVTAPDPARAAVVGAPRGARPVRRVPPRHSLWGVPLSTVVGVEILGAAALLTTAAAGPTAYAALAASAVVGFALAVPVRGGSLAMAVLRRVGFALRTTVATTPSAARRLDEGVPDVLPALHTLYPGLVVSGARDHRGRVFGVAQWAEAATAVLTVSGAAGSLVHPTGSTRLPLAALHERVATSGIPVDALTVLAVSSGTGDASASTGAVPSRGVCIGPRVVLVAVRVRPLDARSAVEARGGGTHGLHACLATLTSGLEATVRDAGLAADLLDVEPLTAALWSVLEPELSGAPADSSATRVESWQDITGPAATHRTVAAQTWTPTASLDAVWSGPGLGRVVAAELLPTPSGRPSARILVRVSEPTVRGAETAATALRRTASALGLGLRPVGGAQADGLRATSLLGQGRPYAAPADVPALAPLDGRLPVPAELLDLLAPVVGSGLDIGTDDDGVDMTLELVRARPQRVLAVGQGWLATEVAARAARAGLPVTVVTDRPAPWLVMARESGVEHLVRVVSDDRAAEPADGARSHLVVVEGGAAARTPSLGRAAWQCTLQVVPRVESLPAGLVDGADLVLVAAGAGEDSATVGALLRLPGPLATRVVQLAGGEVLALSRGVATSLRLGTGVGPFGSPAAPTLVG
jgi:type VII secretion protein EccE